MPELTMIFDEHKMAVVPIRKVASTTIRETLKEVFKHNEYRSGGVLDVPPSYHVLVWVRNPYARAVSFWRSQIRDTKHVLQSLSNVGLAARMSFLSTMSTIAEVQDNVADPHFRSQYFQIPCSVHKRDIFHLEQIDSQWNEFREKIHAYSGRWIRKVPEMRNFTQTTPWEDEYDDVTLTLVERRYPTDVGIFGAEPWTS